MPDPATAALFPGQGSQTPGMRDIVAADAPDLLERSLELVGEDPFARVDDSTRFAQPAIYCASMAGWRRAAGDVTPVAMAGHSLGELTALVAAGAIDALDGLELAVLRGRLMWEAAESAGDGAMLAVLGGAEDGAARLAAEHGVVVANDNAPGQVVLSGSAAAIAAAGHQARTEGLRAIELGVAGAFHSPAMVPAVEPFAASLERTPFRSPAVPVISCLTAQQVADPRRSLAAGLTQPVRWAATMRALAERRVRRFLDAGPGQVLAKLARRNVAGAEAQAIAAPEVARA